MPKPAQFSKSKISNLQVHRSGNYYAVTKVFGKTIRRSLTTKDYNIAKNRLPSILTEIRGAKNATKAGTIAQALHDEAHRADPSIKSSTRHYYKQISTALAKLSKSQSLDVLGISITRVTVDELRKLLYAYGASSSPTRYNGALALMRRVFDRAVEAEHLATNPLRKRGGDGKPLFKRMTPEEKNHSHLPTVESFADIVQEIVSQKKSHSKAVAMAVELLAYTGLRISEGQRLKWRDIKKDHILIRTSKNETLRQIPLIPAARDLFERLRAAGVPTGPDNPVMLVKSPRIALQRACERLGIEHLRVHDLRHIYATRCIEAGVDMPTIAKWMGHKDGGVIAMQVYGHLTDTHSTAMAERVMA
jgi:integrase